MFSFATEIFGLLAGLDGVVDCAGFAAAAGLLPPRLEKFHFSPFSDRTRSICGWFRVRSVTFKVFEKISGINSTPTFSDFAWTNGCLLNWGSSAIEMLSALIAPDSSESERLPTFTSRPIAPVSSDSSLGRNVFTSMRNGIATITTIRIPRIMARIFAIFTMRNPLARPQFAARPEQARNDVKSVSPRARPYRDKRQITSRMITQMVDMLDTASTLCCSVGQRSLDFKRPCGRYKATGIPGCAAIFRSGAKYGDGDYS